MEKPTKQTLSTKVAEVSGQDKDKIVIEQLEASSYKGPLPHPQDFQAYENTLSGAANRILALAEEQMRHRHEMEKRSITLEETKAELVRSSLNIKHDEGKRGQQYALFLSLVVVLAGCFFAYLGYDKSGATIISLTLIGIIGAFVNNIRKEKTQPKQ